MGHWRTLEQLRNDVALRRHLILPESGRFRSWTRGQHSEGVYSRLRPPTASCDTTTTATFTLIRANKNRGGGDDDFDVRDGDRVIGRIVRHPQAPNEAPWFWAVTAESHKPSLTDRGYAASREDAMAQFKTQWSRDELVCHRVADVPTPHVPSFIVRCFRCNAQIWVALNGPSDAKRICSHCAEDRDQDAR